MKNAITVIISLALFSFKGYCQPIHSEPKDFPNLFSRTLLVEVLEEDPTVIKHLEKRMKKHPEIMDNYKAFVRLYNENMKLAIDKFWTLNRQVEFKTTSELNKLQIEKNNSYVGLFYSESHEHFVDYQTKENLVIPTLNYSRIEKGNRHIDYSFYLPVSFLRPHDAYIESDLIFAVQFMQNNMEYMVNKNKKMTATSFAKHAETNCSSLQTKTLLLDNALLSDTISMEEIRNNYNYKFNIVSADKINEAVEGSDGEYAYLVSMPYEMPTVGGTGASAQVVCTRLVVDAKDGHILSVLGSSVREHDSKMFLSKDFIKCAECAEEAKK